ncbi:site-specific integrase [Ruminococcus albus]|uniref:Site-specific recombinase XerD n=1 Tax=Ruminococcus albus TaxID=1264 RepID=A0A1I1RFL0_RUMAL|nr:site-specific integrase [Ruminococcus albus]SFD18490.1 Site-specific recombinase XerD [Ruminococcus albus]SFD33012.1 Site-specific recombinase XerD [Ruminococcus albus]
MIDSNCAMTLYDAIQFFREYIIQNYGADSETAKTYIRIADDFQHYAGNKEAFSSPESIIQEYYVLTIGVPPFQSPPSKYKERSARAIRMIQDIITANEPKRRYLNYRSVCPVPYQTILRRYEILMRNDQKSNGTIYTRSGRMKVFFVFLAGRQCTALGSITPKLFADFVSSLNNGYSSQGKASLLYTLRNFFSYDVFLEMLSFDPFPFLTGIHSRKHERLPSIYTADEVRRVMNAVDRSTPWGKTIYLMMLFACVYGLRSSDIKALSLENINWKSRSITITQYKTHREVTFPLTDEILFALLDYIKNARHNSDSRNLFIRLRKPYIPYSMNDHFGDKIFKYFEIAGVDTKGKHHGLHSLRHSLATNLLSSGIPVNEIAVILGHTSAASTKTYVWSDIEHLRIAALEVPKK